MFTKMMMLFTALPLTLALCSDANARSDAAKARQPLCTELAGIQDRNDPRFVLKEFCDKTTFHCTTHARGGIGILGKVKGACDDPRVCKNEVIYQACKEQCVDLRTDQFGKKDKKSKNIQSTLEKCQISPKTSISPPPQRRVSAPSRPTTVAPVTAPRRNSMSNPGTFVPQEVVPPSLNVPPPPTDLPPPFPLDVPTTPFPSDVPTTPSELSPPSMDLPPYPSSMDLPPYPSSMDVTPPPPPPMNVPPPPSGLPPVLSTKPVDQAAPQDLLSQIRGGKELKKSTDRKLQPLQEDTSLAGALKRSMEERRYAFNPIQNDVHEDDDNDDWLD